MDDALASKKAPIMGGNDTLAGTHTIVMTVAHLLRGGSRTCGTFGSGCTLSHDAGNL